MDFDIWYYKHQADIGYSKMKKAFEVGQQSKQAEIDALKAKIKYLEKWVEENKKSIPLSEWHGYTTEEYVDADDLLELLK